MFGRENSVGNSNYRAGRKRSLRLESLADRQLMAADVVLGSFPVVQQSAVAYVNTTNNASDQSNATIDNFGKIRIDGTEVADRASVSVDNRGTSSTADDQLVVRVRTLGQTSENRFLRSAVTRIEFLGRGGNDKFYNYTSVRSDAYGGAGHDFLMGGSNIDYLYGNGG